MLEAELLGWTLTRRHDGRRAEDEGSQGQGFGLSHLPKFQTPRVENQELRILLILRTVPRT